MDEVVAKVSKIKQTAAINQMKMQRRKELALKNQDMLREIIAADNANARDERPMQYAKDSPFDTKRSFNVKSMSKSPAPKQRNPSTNASGVSAQRPPQLNTALSPLLSQQNPSNRSANKSALSSGDTANKARKTVGFETAETRNERNPQKHLTFN